MYVSYECCVLSGRGLYGGSVPCPDESYRVCLYVCVTEGERAQQQPSTRLTSRWVKLR